MNWKRASIAMLVALPLLLVLAFGMTHDPREIISPLPGKAAPPFSLAVFRRAAGDPRDTISLESLKGDVVVLNFWASWCAECRGEHPILTAAAERYAGSDVHFVGVLFNDTPANGLQWIDAMGGQPYPALADPGSHTAIDYGLYGVPETFFIGRDGRVAFKQVGPVTAQLLAQKIDSLRALPKPADAPRVIGGERMDGAADGQRGGAP